MKTRQSATGIAMVLAAGIVWLSLTHRSDQKVGRDAQSRSTVSSLSALLSIPRETLGEVDIAWMNLLCAQGLPGAEDLDVNGSLAALDRMAERVRSETERHLYRFQQNPAEFENSEGFFRMIMLGVVLAEDFQVHYAPNKRGAMADARMGDGFFADAHDVFLHGLTGPTRAGTCSSLPVLQVAVGRRLGYPLKLVATRGHLFVRWENARERFNIEAAGQGVNRFTDDYYCHWPVETSEHERQTEGYLKSLTPPEELAVFLSIRGACLRESQRHAEAAGCFRAASRLAPGCRAYRILTAQAEHGKDGAVASTRGEN